MRPDKNKRADTLRERIVFQAVLLTLAGFIVWLNGSGLFQFWGLSAPSEAVAGSSAYLARDVQLCTSESASASCVTVGAGTYVDVIEHGKRKSLVRAGGFSGFVKTSALKWGN